MGLARIYKTILDNMNEEVYVRDLDMNLLYLNPAAEKLTGWPLNQALGRKCWEIFGDADRDCQVMCPVNRAISERHSLLHHEGEIMTSGGELKVVQVSISPVYEQGAIIAALVVLKDITRLREVEQTNVKSVIRLENEILNRKRVEQSLRESEERYRFLAENMADIVWTLDRNLNTTYISPSIKKVLGLPPEQRLEQTLTEMMTPLSYQRVMTRLQEELQRDEQPDVDPDRSIIIEVEYYHADGHIVWLENSVKALRDQTGAFAGLCGSSRDITERKKLEAERLTLERRLQQAEKAESLARMAGAIAHNFNNLLGAVLGYLELAMDDLPPAGTIAENLTNAKMAALKAAETSSLMLDFLGQPLGKPRALDLSETCRHYLEQMKPQIPATVTLETDLPTPGPIIKADSTLLERALAALITNALEALGKLPGEVSVSTDTVRAPEIPGEQRFPPGWEPSAETYACLAVTDTGRGMETEVINRIFDPFYTDKFVGRGLGLPIALGIVKSLGGCISVDSRAGRKSTFRVFIPLSPEIVRQPEHKQGGEPLAATAGGTVLLVEDQDLMRQAATAILKKMGFDVLTAGDGTEALDVFRERSAEIRLVLSDLTMPRLNGWETLEALRRIQPDIPVILSSGYDEESVLARDHVEQPQAFLHKPYEIKALKTLIERILGETIKIEH